MEHQVPMMRPRASQIPVYWLLAMDEAGFLHAVFTSVAEKVSSGCYFILEENQVKHKQDN